MAETTQIEWTDATFNMWRGCTRVSAGCEHCYAETLSGRNHKTLGTWGPKGERVIAAESYWRQPLKWNRDAQAAGVRRRVFCASLADVFEGPETMPPASRPAVLTAQVRLFLLIEKTPWLDWLILTKRPQNVMDMVPQRWQDRFPANVWIGTSVEDQATADERIPHLLKVPAAVRFLSAEPLLGPVDLFGDAFTHGEMFGPAVKAEYHKCNSYFDPDEWDESIEPGVDWVICGGESGPGARPMHPDWARSLRDQCAAAEVAFFFKQWGEWRAPVESDGDYSTGYGNMRRPAAFLVSRDDGSRHCFYPADDESVRPEESKYQAMLGVGKKAAGRLLDGREHNEYPAVAR